MHSRPFRAQVLECSVDNSLQSSPATHSDELPASSLAVLVLARCGRCLPPRGSGGSGAAAAVNPSEPLAQIQFQNYFKPHTYDFHGYVNTFILQPVIPINLNSELEPCGIEQWLCHLRPVEKA
jgi:hypothetical protein